MAHDATQLPKCDEKCKSNIPSPVGQDKYSVCVDDRCFFNTQRSSCCSKHSEVIQTSKHLEQIILTCSYKIWTTFEIFHISHIL